MKKEITLVVGNKCLSGFSYQCVDIVGDYDKLALLAFDLCPEFQLVNFKDKLLELWFYRDVMIFRDCNDDLNYCVPLFHLGTCRYSSLRNAKAAISRFINKNVAQYDL